MRPRVVMKFGGTSLGGVAAVKRTVEHITREPDPPLVVVSAVGGVTNQLLAAADTARRGEDPSALVGEIERRHHEILSELGLDLRLVDDLVDELRDRLQGIRMLRELTPRVQDMVASVGERMSARLVAAALAARDRPARAWNSWDLGFTTSDCYGRAEPSPGAAEAIREAITELDATTVPVVTGYIGRTDAGEITTLGRGGSDFSASIFGVAAGVEEIQVWTDVPGILRADPQVVDGAHVVPSMHFDEAAELAFFGARVLHPRTIEPARQQGVPVRVLGTFAVDPADPTPVSAQGTLIDDGAPAEPIRALAMRREVQSLHIHSLRMLDAHGFLARVFDILTDHQISVDVIATSEVSVSMTFDRTEGDVRRAVEEISAFAEVELIPDRSLLCLVGSGLRKDTSLLARIFRVLADSAVPVRVISQGASRINITVVTSPEAAPVAMRALHQDLFPA